MASDNLSRTEDVLENDELFYELYSFALEDETVYYGKDEYFDDCPDLEDNYSLANVAVNVVESSAEAVKILCQNPILSSYNEDEIKVMYAHAIALFYQSEYAKRVASSKAESWRTDKFTVEEYESANAAYEKGNEHYIEDYQNLDRVGLLSVIVDVYGELAKENNDGLSNNC